MKIYCHNCSLEDKYELDEEEAYLYLCADIASELRIILSCGLSWIDSSTICWLCTSDFRAYKIVNRSEFKNNSKPIMVCDLI